MEQQLTMCPRCRMDTLHPSHYAPSRRDNLTHICSACGSEEALFDMAYGPNGMEKTEPGLLNSYEREMLWLRRIVYETQQLLGHSRKTVEMLHGVVADGEASN